ncbi:hypothetical protein DSO57_1014162 [Entomophthora muscae]|nr:hypothetical protein DSO57_1014162 [Entomophthora muscae]
MVTVPIGPVIAGLNVGALAHQLGSLFPTKWVPNIYIGAISAFIRQFERLLLGRHYGLAGVCILASGTHRSLSLQGFNPQKTQAGSPAVHRPGGP